MKKLLLSSPFLLLLLILFNPVKVLGQGVQITPDCVVYINVTLAAQGTVAIPAAATAGGVGDNRTNKCQTWTLSYQATGAGALTSVDFQSGQSSTTTVTFASWTGTVNTGINPNTSSTGATSTYSTGCVNAIACTIPNAWVQVLITRGTFVGTINGVLYGYKTGADMSVTVVNASCAGTVVTPCIVAGTAADGAPSSGNPVQVGGVDSVGNARHLSTNNNGVISTGQSTAGADGVANTTAYTVMGQGSVAAPIANMPYMFNSATWDRQFACTFQAVYILAPGTTGVMITGVMGKNTKICHIHASSLVNTNLTITSGTGAVCNMGTATIDGYINVSSIAMDFSPLSPLKANAVGDDICYTFSPGGIIDLTVIYAQY